MASLTAANAIIMLSVPGLTPAPVQLQGFAPDDVFSTDPIERTEVQMGVDFKLSGGLVAVPVKWMVNLQADSLSNAFFDVWDQAQVALSDVLPANGFSRLRSIGTSWVMTKGFLTTFPVMPDAKKLLQPRKFGITWESIVPVPG